MYCTQKSPNKFIFIKESSFWNRLQLELILVSLAKPDDCKWNFYPNWCFF